MEKVSAIFFVRFDDVLDSYEDLTGVSWEREIDLLCTDPP